jgi:thymine dioxygenase
MDPSEVAKKRRIESMFVAPMGGVQRTPEEMKEAYDAAVQAHPFVDLSEHRVEVCDNAVFSDGAGSVVGVLIRGGIPEKAAVLASDVLRTAASRTSLRATIFGGEAPLSGIAGYYDYSGSPIELKCRKTSFTCEVIKSWPNVFPMVEYVSELYRGTVPSEWKAQNNAIPDVVRVNNSPFSTLTINQRFRTASHTDAGDFDAGYGVLAVLEGDFDGLHLGLTDFRVCFHMKPRDVLIFNTHHFHANTELERFGHNPEWNRLTCVFYYRAILGEHNCLNNYQRRLDAAKKIPRADRVLKSLPPQIVAKDNGENHNRPATVVPVFLTPFLAAASTVRDDKHWTAFMSRMHALMADRPKGTKGFASNDTVEQTSLNIALFGEESMFPLVDGLYPRSSAEKADQDLQVTIRTGSALGGFSEASGAVDVASKNHTLLEERSLKDAMGGDTELWKIWIESRTKWLALVKRDWDQAVERNPERIDFSWKNKSDMNTAFFDLCDVGKNVMQQLLDKEDPTRSEENAFWLCFAGHLYHSCEHELQMVKDAMSMRKLNVKLKDYNFGGTRYFTDMPKEEQERRIARRKKIEEARKRGAAVERDFDSNWLENDDFDYQSESAPVEYKAKGWTTPAANAQERVKTTATEHVKLIRSALGVEMTGRIVVVHPKTQSGEIPSASLDMIKKAEYQRLVGNRAAQRSLGAELPDMCIPTGTTEWQPFPGVTVQFMSIEAFTSNEGFARAQGCNLVVLRHCLCTIGVEAASELIKTAVRCGHTMIVESVASCRSEYRLPIATLDSFREVAPVVFPQLLSRWLPALPPLREVTAVTQIPFPRTKSEIRACVDSAAVEVVALYHFPHSPRNTSVWVCPRAK